MSHFGAGALGRVVRSGVGRRRVQTLVITLATLMAVTSAIVAGALMVASSGPFDQGFAHQHGAQLTAQIDGSKAGADQVAATGRLAGVTASAGPYEQTVINPVGPDGMQWRAMTTVGRATATGGGVDEVDLRSGRWATGQGEIVLSADSAAPDELGRSLKLSKAADSPALTVVGIAVSVSRTANAWVLPAEMGALRAAGNTMTEQMLYRFSSAATDAQIAADRAELAAALPSGALLGTQSYLSTRLGANQGAAATVPFLMVFGALGLVMSVIIISSVVSGAVGAGVRRIGILKAIGFTPGQVVRAYVGQALIPAGVGIVLGVVLGNLLAMPMLGESQQAYGTAGLGVAWWIDLAVPVAALAVVALAALLPALRAGRLRTVEALAIGRAPRTGRGQWAQRIAARLPLPRPVTLGLAGPFARPVRTAAMLAAVVFGTTTATFAVGLTSSLNAIGVAQSPGDSAAVFVGTVRGGPGGPGGPGAQGPATFQQVSAADDAKLSAAIAAQPGTKAFYGEAGGEATVSGVSGAVQARLFQGDSSVAGFEMISGHWLTGAGQVVVPTHFLKTTGTKLGDTITVLDQGVSARAQIVGEVFDPGSDGLSINLDLDTFAAAKDALPIDQYHVMLKPGVSAAAYAARLDQLVQPVGAEAHANSGSSGHHMIIILKALAATLTLMLLVVAGLGVLNSVVLDTRERVHDLGVCKAIGMSPRHVISQVMASVAGVGVVGAIIGVPAGMALHTFILPVMGHAADTGLTPQITSVYHALELVLLGLGGAAIAVLGALLPASWAAKVRTATALRTE